MNWPSINTTAEITIMPATPPKTPPTIAIGSTSTVSIETDNKNMLYMVSKLIICSDDVAAFTAAELCI